MKTQGIRIQKVLSDQGILSRRKAEEYIQHGRITVNGRPAKIGHPVDIRRDIIAIDGVNVTLQRRKNNVYIILNKPRGYVTTTSDELGRRCVAELVENAPEKVYPVGRLDRNTEGLLLFTNDGAFANTVMHPSNHIAKTYRVTVRPDITDEQAALLSAGVMLDDRMTLPAQVLVLDKQPGRVVLQITIHEGRNRQIRRMCEAVGLEVVRLKRTSVGPIKLGMLKPGEWRELTPSELIALRGSVNKNTKAPQANNPQQVLKSTVSAGKKEKQAAAGYPGRGNHSQRYDERLQKAAKPQQRHDKNLPDGVIDVSGEGRFGGYHKKKNHNDRGGYRASVPSNNRKK